MYVIVRRKSLITIKSMNPYLGIQRFDVKIDKISRVLKL